MIRKLVTPITHHLLLVTILLVAALLRFWQLDINPPHLTSDEAALGYNAYSILKTGRDEYGELLPLIFKSFGDWKPGLYVYLTVPFVAILGLAEWSVRLPSAIAGIAAVGLVYCSVGELFKNEKLKILASLMLAISPWHVHFSRGAWEANLSLTLTLAGIYLFLRFVKDGGRSIYLSVIFFALTLWTYQGAKLSTALVVAALLLAYRKRLGRFTRKQIAQVLILGFVLVLPIILSVFQGQAGRLAVFSFFSYRRPVEYVAGILNQEGVGINSWQYILYHSEPLNNLRGVLYRWTNYYSARFLFFEGDWANARHGAPDVGVLLLADLPLLILGLLYLARSQNRNAKWFVLLWLLLAPLPAALSRDTIQGVRSLNLVIPLTLLSGCGVAFVFEAIRGRKFAILLLCYLAIYAINYVYFLDQYWVHYPLRSAKGWQYGYKQTIMKTSKEQNDYKQIVFQQSYNQPYIFFLFFQKYDPAKYQQVSKKTYQEGQFGDVGLVSGLDNITFRDATAGDLHNKGTLIVFDPEHPPFAELSQKQPDGIYKEITRPDDSVAFELLSWK